MKSAKPDRVFPRVAAGCARKENKRLVFQTADRDGSKARQWVPFRDNGNEMLHECMFHMEILRRTRIACQRHVGRAVAQRFDQMAGMKFI